jgi:hypothetical protein
MSDPSYSPATVSTEGRHARERGDPIDANPYPAGSDPHRSWKRGYESVDGEAEATLGAEALDDDT